MCSDSSDDTLRMCAEPFQGCLLYTSVGSPEVNRYRNKVQFPVGVDKSGKHRHIQSSDAGKGICNILLLGAQLGSIVQMPQADVYKRQPKQP